MLSRRRYDRGSQAAGRVSPMDSGYNLLMVQHIKPYPVRQATAGGWRVVSDMPLHGARDDRWWCIGHMVRGVDVRPALTTHLLSRDDDRKFLVW
jgi:hypothetical protein